MKLLNKSSIKYKLLTKDELIINLDRLSRFKLPDYSFNRVYTDIITKCLISPKYSKDEIEKSDADYIAAITEKIWNDSVKKIYKNNTENNIALSALQIIIKNTFKNISPRTECLINSELNINPILNDLDYNKSPFNLKFLIKVNSDISDKKELTTENLNKLCKKYGFYYPVKKLLIVEGITEEILLPAFAKKSDNDFDKNGIYVQSAGGKSKSPALYLKLKDKLKIPVILLFDSDAKEICSNLSKMLLKKDKYIIIEKGEFEDILSENIIKRTLNSEYEPATQLILDDLRIHNKMCKNIEEFYRSRHLGEFKKSKFAKLIASNIKYQTDITKEIKEILSEILW